jgi:hypothetical protein
LRAAAATVVVVMVMTVLLWSGDPRGWAVGERFARLPDRRLPPSTRCANARWSWRSARSPPTAASRRHSPPTSDTAPTSGTSWGSTRHRRCARCMPECFAPSPRKPRRPSGGRPSLLRGRRAKPPPDVSPRRCPPRPHPASGKQTVAGSRVRAGRQPTGWVRALKAADADRARPGDVVELGPGTGANLRYYRPDTRLVAIETGPR